MSARPGSLARAVRCVAWTLALAFAGMRVAHAEPVLAPLAPDSGYVAPVATPDSTAFERASARFERARYAAAAGLLRPALADGSIGAADRTAALELLGRSLVRLGDPEGGVDAFTRLLDAAPGWTMLARRVSDDERAVFARARDAWRTAHPDYVLAEAEAAAHAIPPRAWYRQHRYQAAGGAAILGLAAGIIRHQGRVNDAHQALPDLPGHP